ncbi:MAG TPA: tRNA-dihydrouridine synthase family protein [Candidatus Thermoplasmatota archaeon]|nr:tRNA-dihydrouridine synthase family protein [Candidatus Thermoplasmatota archaeon]
MPDLLRPLAIGGVRLPNNLVLSPMAGFSDLPFRVLCRRHGAGLVCSEMVSAVGVTREVPDTILKMRTLEEETPMSIQLFGTDASLVRSAAAALDARCDIVGFNMGCPAHQIKKQGCGAAMLDDPENALRMLDAVRAGTDRPLLVKMRLGNGRAIDYVAFARALERAGAAALIVHGRTAAMGYSGRSDWGAIARIKEALSIPVIGNGDITDGPSAERALATGVDGIALGRATLGDPHVFHRIATYLRTGEPVPEQTPAQRLADFEAYVGMAEAIGIKEIHMREQAQQFTRGLRGGGDVRTAFTKKQTPAQMVARFREFVAARSSSERPLAPGPRSAP